MKSFERKKYFFNKNIISAIVKPKTDKSFYDSRYFPIKEMDRHEMDCPL